MRKRDRYTYVLLQYQHDPAAAELVNIGVALHCGASGYVGCEVRKTIGRLSKTFPGIDATHIKRTLKFIKLGYLKLAKDIAKTQFDFDHEKHTALSLAEKVLRKDGSSFIWSELRSGVTSNPESTLKELYARFVAKYDDSVEHGRSDEVVWQPVKEWLEDHNLTERVRPKTIVSTIDEVEFDGALKNGVWHCYQALSFDLTNEENIRRKAARWAGHMLGISQANEQVRPYFLVGAPSQTSLSPTYEKAIALLRASNLKPVVFEENETKELTRKIAEIADSQ